MRDELYFPPSSLSDTGEKFRKLAKILYAHKDVHMLFNIRSYSYGFFRMELFDVIIFLFDQIISTKCMKEVDYCKLVHLKYPGTKQKFKAN